MPTVIFQFRLMKWLDNKLKKKFTNLIKQEMTSVKDSDLHSFSTPLTVDVNSGDNWGLLH